LQPRSRGRGWVRRAYGRTEAMTLLTSTRCRIYRSCLSLGDMKVLNAPQPFTVCMIYTSRGDNIIPQLKLGDNQIWPCLLHIGKKLLLKVVKKAVPLFFIMVDAVGPEYNNSPTDGYEFHRKISIHTVYMYSMYAEVSRGKS
jgi:hypothetical protein